MTTKLYSFTLLLSATALLLTGCPPPEQTTPPKQETTELNNQISFGGQIYDITLAGTSTEDAVYLYFESGEDVEASFALNLGEGVFRITKSGTFTFDEAEDGMPGTFFDGWFEVETNGVEVISGTIVVSVSGDVYTIKADCKCEGGKDLTIRYTGALKYEGPSGTTTFTVNGVAFPYAYAFISPTEVNEEHGHYTEIEINALDGTEDVREFECYLRFFHSEPSLAGTYTCKVDEPSGSEIVYGVLGVDLSDYESINGILSEGQITIGIEGDIYTITFEDVKLSIQSDLIDVTGAYTGTMVPEPNGE